MATHIRLCNILLILIGLAARPAWGDVTAPANAPVAALLGKCMACHSGAKPAGGLNLSARGLALKGGVSGAGLVPSKAEQSLLFKRVAAKQMPPQSPLSKAETETLRRWINDGAAWPDLTPQRADQNWWSLRPVKRPAIPTPPSSPLAKGGQKGVSKIRNPQSAIRNPIDAFILAELKKRGLAPAPPADKRTLLRRVTYDLIGLPPTPEEISAFLADKSPNAYEKVIDRLLADPRYGERWGRHWLDVARFGESHGFERDQMRPNAWRYRDYVIEAFNSDKPYDQFIREQLAGDVLPSRTRDSLIATGFLVSGPYDEVGQTQVSNVMRTRVREEELEEMIGTVSQTFLGLTTNCARCHDHKFDPIPQRDYYRLKAAFEGVKHGNRSILTPDEEKVQKAKAEELNQQIAAIQTALVQTQNTIRARALAANGSPPVPNGPAPFARWTFETDAQDTQGVMHGTLQGGARVEGGRLYLDGKRAYLRSAPLPTRLTEKTLEVWAILRERGQGGGGLLTLQTPDGTQFDSIVYGEQQPGKWAAGSDSFRRTKDLNAPAENAAPDALIHLAIVYRADNSIAVYRNGKPYAAPYTPTGSAASLRTYPAGQTEVLIGLRHAGAVNGFLKGDIEEARLYNRALTPEEVAVSFQAGVESLSPEALNRVTTAEEQKQIETLRKEQTALQASLKKIETPPLAYAANPTEPPATHLLPRGDVENLGEALTASGLSCIIRPSAELNLSLSAPEGERRRKLADWIAHPDNPLTARVLVNRIWHYHFGRGIVGTPNDFGFNGERPTHPELLDWLAATFVAKALGAGRWALGNTLVSPNTQRPAPNAQRPMPNAYACGWSIKKLHKLILLAATYRQSSRFDAKAAAQDADDHYLWRFAPHRLEGEAVRDAMLFVSGNLNSQRGGPSFQPFTFFVDNSHFYTLTDSAEPEFNRRTVYRMQVQSAKSPLLETLDCPDPSTKTPRRPVTTTPLQAMQLMNSPFVLRQAQGLAARLEKEANTPAARIRLAYRLAFGREPSEQEIVRAEAFLRAQNLTDFCWVLLNSSEFVYIR